MTSGEKPTYREYVRVLSEEHRGLATLSDMLNLSKPPYESKPVVALIDYPRRLDMVSPPVISVYENPKEMTALPTDCHGRIIIVEDIHGPLIEQLGSQLDIEPLFFASHIAPNPGGPIDPLLASSRARLPSQLVRRGDLHLTYKRLLDLGDIHAFEKEHPQRSFKTISNIARSAKPLPYSLGNRQLAVLSACCSVTLKLRSDSWICLMLVDPVVSVVRAKSAPLVPSNDVPCKEFHRSFTLDELPSYASFLLSSCEYKCSQNTMQERITRSFRYHPPGFERAEPTIMSLTYNPIRLAAAEWVGHTKLMFQYLKHYDFSRPTKETEIRFNESNIYTLNKWHYLSCISLSRLKHLAGFVTYWSSSSDEQAYVMLLKDIEDLSLQTKDLIQALEHKMQVITSMIQLLDTRRSITEAVNVKRVTYIALVFVPLSWVASLFSMSDEYSPGGSRFWVYFATGLPLVGVVLSLSALPYDRIWNLKGTFSRPPPGKKISNAPGSSKAGEKGFSVSEWHV